MTREKKLIATLLRFNLIIEKLPREQPQSPEPGERKIRL
jgi:hypothetical protein